MSLPTWEKLFTCILHHGYVPSCVTAGIAVSIVEDKLDSANYREITLSSVICKILKLVITEKCEQTLLKSNVQFGFKSKHSTTLCTFLVRETAEYFNKRGSPAYCCFLDGCKAFDRASHFV